MEMMVSKPVFSGVQLIAEHIVNIYHYLYP